MWRTGIMAPRSAPSPCSAPRRSVACSPGCRLFTVTPSGATSPASVLRKPVTPARAVFERIRVGIGWRTEIDVIATTLPHPCVCIAGTAALHIAIVDSAFSANARVYSSTSSNAAKSPAGGPPALGTRMSTPPSADRAASTKPVAPATVPTSATSPTASPPMCAAAASTVSASRPQIATRTPSAASACAAAKPSPFDAAATAARLPAIPRSIEAGVSRSGALVDGAVAGAEGRDGGSPRAQGDDLGADRDRRLLRGAPTDVEADRRHHARHRRVVDPDLAEPGETRRVGPPGAHRADVPDVGGQRADDGRDVELGVVGEDAHGVARTELLPDTGEEAVGPCVHDDVGHGEPRRGSEHGTRVAHRHVVPEQLRDPGQRRG